VKNILILLIATILSLNTFSQSDSCFSQSLITFKKFSLIVNKFEKNVRDSLYWELNNCDKVTLIRIINTIESYKQLYSAPKFLTFRKFFFKNGWLNNILDKLEGVSDFGEYTMPNGDVINYRRYTFSKYKIYYGPPVLTNSVFKLINLKPEHKYIGL